MMTVATEHRTTERWTVQKLKTHPPEEGDWNRYEIMAGELYRTRAPHYRHQGAASKLHFHLEAWSESTGLGETFEVPGVIFTAEDAVIPDLVWISKQRIAEGTDEAGHFTLAPELMVEVLSGSASDQRRDKETKLKLYSAHGVQEYWIVSWQLKTIEVYRRRGDQLEHIETLSVGDSLTSPLLPGFSVAIAQLFPID